MTHLWLKTAKSSSICHLTDGLGSRQPLPLPDHPQKTLAGTAKLASRRSSVGSELADRPFTSSLVDVAG